MKAPTYRSKAPVDFHENAILNPMGRAQMIERLETDESVTEMAASTRVGQRAPDRS